MLQPEIQAGENMGLEAQIPSISFFQTQPEFGLEDSVWNHLDPAAHCLI